MKQNLFFASFWAVVGVLTAILLKLLFSVAGPVFVVAVIMATVAVFILTARTIITSFEKEEEN